MGMLTLVITVILGLVSLFIYWMFLHEIAKEYGWFAGRSLESSATPLP